MPVRKEVSEISAGNWSPSGAQRRIDLEACKLLALTRQEEMGWAPQAGQPSEASHPTASATPLLSALANQLSTYEVTQVGCPAPHLDWLYSFLTTEEQDRLTGWHLGVSL